jgi:hypothetical protein
MLSPRNLLLAVLLFSSFVPLGNAVTWTSIDYPGAEIPPHGESTRRARSWGPTTIPGLTTPIASCT